MLLTERLELLPLTERLELDPATLRLELELLFPTLRLDDDADTLRLDDEPATLLSGVAFVVTDLEATPEAELTLRLLLEPNAAVLPDTVRLRFLSHPPPLTLRDIHYVLLYASEPVHQDNNYNTCSAPL